MATKEAQAAQQAMMMQQQQAAMNKQVQLNLQKQAEARLKAEMHAKMQAQAQLAHKPPPAQPPSVTPQAPPQRAAVTNMKPPTPNIQNPTAPFGGNGQMPRNMRVQQAENEFQFARSPEEAQHLQQQHQAHSWKQKQQQYEQQLQMQQQQIQMLKAQLQMNNPDPTKKEEPKKKKKNPVVGFLLAPKDVVGDIMKGNFSTAFTKENRAMYLVGWAVIAYAAYFKFYKKGEGTPFDKFLGKKKPLHGSFSESSAEPYHIHSAERPMQHQEYVPPLIQAAAPQQRPVAMPQHRPVAMPQRPAAMPQRPAAMPQRPAAIVEGPKMVPAPRNSNNTKGRRLGRPPASKSSGKRGRKKHESIDIPEINTNDFKI